MSFKSFTLSLKWTGTDCVRGDLWLGGGGGRVGGREVSGEEGDGREWGENWLEDDRFHWLQDDLWRV